MLRVSEATGRRGVSTGSPDLGLAAGWLASGLGCGSRFRAWVRPPHRCAGRDAS